MDNRQSHRDIAIRVKMKKSIGIGLLGLGVVAGQVARVLTEKADELAEKVGCPLVLRKIKVLPQDLAASPGKKDARPAFYHR